MKKLWLPWMVLSLAACVEEQGDAAVYRLVVADVADLLAPVALCLSPTRWYSEDLLEEDVRSALTRDGYHFMPRDQTPDTSVRVLTLSPIREDSTGRHVVADIGQIVLTNGGPWWEGADYEYTVACDGRCSIVERIGPGSSVAGVGSERAAVLASGRALTCPP